MRFLIRIGIICLAMVWSYVGSLKLQNTNPGDFIIGGGMIALGVVALFLMTRKLWKVLGCFATLGLVIVFMGGMVLLVSGGDIVNNIMNAVTGKKAKPYRPNSRPPLFCPRKPRRRRRGRMPLPFPPTLPLNPSLSSPLLRPRRLFCRGLFRKFWAVTKSSSTACPFACTALLRPFWVKNARTRTDAVTTAGTFPPANCRKSSVRIPFRAKS